jgi:uncharacterized OB-fold protein
LDGSDSVLDHFINIEPVIDKIKVGMRMRAVLRPRKDRIGDLSDILYFEPPAEQKKSVNEEFS